MTHLLQGLGFTLDGPEFALLADGRTYTPASMTAAEDGTWQDGSVTVHLEVTEATDGSRGITLRATGVRHVTEVCLLDVAMAPAPVQIHNHRWYDDTDLQSITDDGVQDSSFEPMQQSTVVFVRGDGGGFFACYANPFGRAEVAGDRLRLSYRPGLDVSGEFVSDELVVGTFVTTGRTLRRELLRGRDVVCGREPAYGTLAGPVPAELDAGEVAAVRDAVTARIPWAPATAFVSHWDWSENLYRLSITEPETQAIYSRAATICAEMGVDVFLVGPAGRYVFPDPPPRDIAGSDWGDAGDTPWQRIMWLGMGMELARDQWAPGGGLELPGTFEVLGAIEDSGVKPVPYVNPQYPWQRAEDRMVIDAEGSVTSMGCMAHPAASEWLLVNGTKFLDHYRLKGMSWDFVFWGRCHATNHGHAPGADSQFAEWDGYRRALAAFRDQSPDIWLEGLIGSLPILPWGSRDMTHACQMFGDNQPQWIPAWPDLSTHRVHGNFQRRSAYWVRNFSFTPSFKIGSIVGHTSNRIKWWTPERGWDWDGLRFNLLSAIATAPTSINIGFVPCWDEDEWQAVRDRDVAFIRRWIDWARDNAAVLARMEDLFDEARPGAVDGTIAVDDEGLGFAFLCNPDFDAHAVVVPLPAERVLRELHPEPGRLWDGEVVVEPHEVHVLEVIDTASLLLPAIFGVAAQVDSDGRITAAVGTPGTSVVAVARTAAGDVTFDVAFAGDGVSPTLGPWHDASGREVDLRTATGPVRASTAWTPGAALPALLAELTPGVPPLGDEVLNPWSDPSRLRLFPELLEPESAPVRMWVDGDEVPMHLAYVGTDADVTSPEIGAMTNNMLGRYADLSDRLAATDDLERPWHVEIEVDLQFAGQLAGVRIAHLPRRRTDRFEAKVRPS